MRTKSALEPIICVSRTDMSVPDSTHITSRLETEQTQETTAAIKDLIASVLIRGFLIHCPLNKGTANIKEK